MPMPEDISTAPNQNLSASVLGLDPSRFSQTLADFTPDPFAAFTSAGVTAGSTKDQIAAAYRQYFSKLGGSTDSNRSEAQAYLQKLGISEPVASQGYGTYLLGQRYADYLEQNPDVKAYYQRQGNFDPITSGAEHYSMYGSGESRLGGGFQDTIDSLTKQILEQGTSSKWGGEAFGSADATARDMARLLSRAGLTDLKDFGVRDRVIPAYEDPGETEFGSSPYTVPERTIQEYYNKATGDTFLGNNYHKAGGNTWGGTYAGEGSTAYNVQFRPDGTPVFYTQYGGTSNDFAKLLEVPVLGTLLQVGAGFFGGPLGVAALNVAAGRDIEDVLKAAALSYVGGEIASGVAGASPVVEALGKTGANIAGRVAGAVATGGGVKGALQALAMGGISAAMPTITSLIPGFDDLPDAAKKAATSVIASTLVGKPLDQSIINAAVTAGKDAARTALRNAATYNTNANDWPTDDSEWPTHDDVLDAIAEDAALQATPESGVIESLEDAGLAETPAESAGTLPPVTVTGTREPPADNLDTPFTPITGAPSGGTLPPVTVTGKREPPADLGLELDPVTVTGVGESDPTSTPIPRTPIPRTPTPTPTPTPKAPTPKAPTPKAPTPIPQVQAQTAAALGFPLLANMFYYGKEFGSKKQKLGDRGDLVDEDYRGLSVTAAGAEPWQFAEQLADTPKPDENSADELIQKLTAENPSATTLDELMNIIGRS